MAKQSSIKSSDPLVIENIFYQYFWNIYHPGILAGTTRLLVTHNPAVLQFMDSVVVVKSGELVDQGSYSDLVARGGLAGLLAEGGQQEGVDGEEGSGVEG